MKGHLPPSLPPVTSPSPLSLPPRGTAGKGQHGSTLASSMVELKMTCVAAAKGATMGTQVGADNCG